MSDDPMGKYIAPLDPDVRALVRENANLRAYAYAEKAEADLALTDGALESSVDDADEQRERAEKAEA